jgi:hypothetical protein
MQSTRDITSQLLVVTDTETSESKDNFNEPRKYFNKLAHKLICCENIYSQHIHLKDDTAKMDDTERQLLFLHIKADSDADLAKFVDATIEAKSAMFPTLSEAFTCLNQSLATTLTKTDRLAAYRSALLAIKQMLAHIERINTILDVMPQVIFSQQNQNFPGVAKSKLEAEKVYELITANRRMFSAQYGTQSPSNSILSPKTERPAQDVEQNVSTHRFGNCHV